MKGPHPAVVFLHGSGPEGRYASRFLAQHLARHGIAALIYFFRQIADYNPAVYWQKVSVPALLIYGERDILVPVGPSIANIERALQGGGNRDYTILILPRASHGLSVNPELGQPFEWWHMASGYPDLLTAWINQRMK